MSIFSRIKVKSTFQRKVPAGERGLSGCGWGAAIAAVDLGSNCLCSTFSIFQLKTLVNRWTVDIS